MGHDLGKVSFVVIGLGHLDTILCDLRRAMVQLPRTSSIAMERFVLSLVCAEVGRMRHRKVTGSGSRANLRRFGNHM
jgi:hypothetical protein